MKRIYSILIPFVFGIMHIYGQAPDGFQYQAAVSGNGGVLLKETNVTVRFNIKAETATGTVVYSETHTTTTNSSGLIFLAVGKGTAATGAFASINWTSGKYFLETEIDKGAGFISTGTQQLLSVPYAKYADLAGNVTLTSSNGKKWRITVNDDGTVAAQEITQ
jgi:hypothetical protein